MKILRDFFTQIKIQPFGLNKSVKPIYTQLDPTKYSRNSAT